MALPSPRTSWTPFADLEERFRRLLDEGFGALRLPELQTGFTPTAELQEKDDRYVVRAELPGIAKEEVEVELDERRLVVKGEHKEEATTEGRLHWRTRKTGSFYLEVLLPGTADPDKVSASMDNGVLTVEVPKATGEQRRRITVS